MISLLISGGKRYKKLLKHAHIIVNLWQTKHTFIGYFVKLSSRRIFPCTEKVCIKASMYFDV